MNAVSAAPKPWRIWFEHDVAHDALIAHFESVILVTAADAARWRAEVSQRLASYGRKVDLIINLEGLVVKVGAGSAFGRERAAVLQEFTRHSYRYGGDQLTRSFVNTSGMITGADTNHHATREAALQALLAVRAAAQGGAR